MQRFKIRTEGRAPFFDANKAPCDKLEAITEDLEAKNLEGPSRIVKVVEDHQTECAKIV